MVLTPFAARLARPLYALFRRWRPREPFQTIQLPGEDLQGHVVIAGGGRVGQYVATVLQRLAFPFVVIELDQRRVDQCRDAGIPLIYGDASHPVVLAAAAVPHARLFMLTVPAITVAQIIVREVHRLAPTLRIVARVDSMEYMQPLHALGVSEIVQPEFEAGLEMVRQALLPLDVPAAEIERYTDAVRDELYAPLYQENTGHQPLIYLHRALRQMGLTWIPIAAGSRLVGQTLRELDLRRQTGLSVIAIMRHGTMLPNPDGTQCLQAGDMVGILGTSEQQQAFQTFAQRTHCPPAEEQ
jgi:CPA2 family monovalent cation:H+ antiporter-2